MVLLKMSVGLIVLQGLIVQFMVVTKAEPYDDDSDWDAEQKTQRGYGKSFIFSIIYPHSLIRFLYLPSRTGLD